jgi:hypothetical protein
MAPTAIPALAPGDNPDFAPPPPGVVVSEGFGGDVLEGIDDVCE